MMKTTGQEYFELKEELEDFKDGFKESTLWQLDKLHDKLFFNSKEEKQNFRDPLGLGLTFHELGTPDDYKAKFKKGDKVKLRYGSGFKGEGVIVEGPIKMRASLTPTYRIKLTDGKVVGRYEEELAKNSKDNAKEDVEKIKSQIVSVKAYLKDRLEKQKSISKEVEGTQRELERLEKLLGQNNSKEEKENENFHYLGKTFSVTSGNFKQVRQQVQKAYWDKVKELEVKLRSAEGSEKQSIEKELREIREGYKETLEEFDRFNNEKEKGYYAKLAEEKQERKNYKFTDKEISDYLKSNPSQAKQYVRKKTAGKAENITIHPETLTAELDENGKTHLFKFVSDESLGFILKYMGTK